MSGSPHTGWNLRRSWGNLCFLLQQKLKACFTIYVADFTWFYCSGVILTFTLFLFRWEVLGTETGSRLAVGRRGSQHPGPGCLAKLIPPSHPTPVFPGRCQRCSSTLLPGAYRSGPEEGTFVCAEHCARLGPGGRSGARPTLPPQPKQQQLTEEAKDVERGGPSPNAAAGPEVDVPKASSEGRPQIPTKPQVPGKPQEMASTPGSRPTPAPRKASESTALTLPTPRPRSSLQQENLVEQGGGSGLVNGEQGPDRGWALPEGCLASKRTRAWEYSWGRAVLACVCCGCAGDDRGAEIINSRSKRLLRSLGARSVLHAARTQTPAPFCVPRMCVLLCPSCVLQFRGVGSVHHVCLCPECVWFCVHTQVTSPPRPSLCACPHLDVWQGTAQGLGVGEGVSLVRWAPGALPRLACSVVETPASPLIVRPSHMTSLGFHELMETWFLVT